MPGHDNRNFTVLQLDAVIDYIKGNAISWYEFLDRQKGFGLKNGDLYFLTGCYKTYSWQTATAFKASSGYSASLKLLPAGMIPAGLNLSATSEQNEGNAFQVFSGATHGDRPNQCTSVSGFRVRCRRKYIMFGPWTKVKELKAIDAGKMHKEGKKPVFAYDPSAPPSSDHPPRKDEDGRGSSGSASPGTGPSSPRNGGNSYMGGGGSSSAAATTSSLGRRANGGANEEECCEPSPRVRSLAFRPSNHTQCHQAQFKHYISLFEDIKSRTKAAKLEEETVLRVRKHDQRVNTFPSFIH